MASMRVGQVYLLLALVIMLWHGARSQTACNNAIVGLSPCLNYVSGNTTTPTPACCLQLNNVVQTAPQCLCTLLNNNGGNSALGNININQTQALTLPTACNVQTPSISQCNAVANAPAASPPASPEPTSSPKETSPAPVTNPAKAPAATSRPIAPSASKTVPSSDGIITKPLTALVLFLAALASNNVF